MTLPHALRLDLFVWKKKCTLKCEVAEKVRGRHSRERNSRLDSLALDTDKHTLAEKIAFLVHFLASLAHNFSVFFNK
jgi:hypothetical protein